MHGQFLPEPNLLIWCNIINVSLQIIRSTVCIRDTAGGAFTLTIREMDLKIYPLVSGHVGCSVNLVCCSTHYLWMFVGKCGSRTSSHIPNFLQFSSLMMLHYFIKPLMFNNSHPMHFVLQLLDRHLRINIAPLYCCFTNSILVHLKFTFFCCCNLFSPIHLNLHYSSDCKNYYTHNWVDFPGNCSFTFAFTDINIVVSQNAAFFMYNHFSALSSAVSNRIDWFVG